MVTLTTHNVGGMSVELEGRSIGGGGCKLQHIRQSARLHNPDFMVLTETHVQIENLANDKIIPKKYIVLQSDTSGAPSAGVLILGKKNGHKPIEGSVRNSGLGRFTLAVYLINGSRVIIGGVYGESDPSDSRSNRIMMRLAAILSELSTLYSTSTVLLAGDFNANLKANQSSSQRLRKPRTTDTILSIMDRYDMIDTGDKARILNRNRGQGNGEIEDPPPHLETFQ